MINETQNIEVTTPVSKNRTPPNVPSSGQTLEQGMETKIQLIPWCFPAQLHSGSWIVAFPSVAGAVLGPWDEAVATQELLAASSTSQPTFSPRNSLNRNFNVFDRVSPSGTAGVAPREKHEVDQTVQDLSGGC